MAETGNVILNSCLGSMANMLQRTLSMSLPQVVHGDGRRLFEVVECDEDDSLVLFLYINFAVQERDIRGYIAMLMDLPALVMLKQLIADFIARVIGEEIVLDDANSAISKMKTVDIP